MQPFGCLKMGHMPIPEEIPHDKPIRAAKIIFNVSILL